MCPLSLLCLLPAFSQALREAVAALYDKLKPEQLVVCVPEEGALRANLPRCIRTNLE
jgi:siroheme synthase